jgi:hypothetical protein
LFALRVELASPFGLESIFHLLFGARSRPGRRLLPLFKLLFLGLELRKLPLVTLLCSGSDHFVGGAQLLQAFL